MPTKTEFLVVKNRAISTLAGDINDSVTALTVATGEGTNFPSTFPFHITMEDEICSVTARTGDSFGTIVRAQQGTSAAAHVAGVSVQLRKTAKEITDLNTAVNALESPVCYYGSIVCYDGSAIFY